MTDMVDWTEILKAVALEISGQPTEHRGLEWRYGRHGSLVVNVGGQRAGVWHDFEAGQGGGALEFLRHYQGLDKRQALEWLRVRGLLQGSPQSIPRRPQTPTTIIASHIDQQRPSEPIAPNPQAHNRLERAHSWWNRSQQIPTSQNHPARKWLANRKLWRAELPLPAAVRWIPATGRHTGAGTIVALAAKPEAWETAWPDLPVLATVQLVHIDKTGRPVLDRPAENGGLSKRTLGLAQGAVVVLGNPCLQEVQESIHIAEGLADAIALASRHEGTAIAALGTSGMTDGTLAKWLASSYYSIQIHCDADEPKQGRPPAGRRAAATLLLAIKDAGGQAVVAAPSSGFKDVADEAAAGSDFGPLADGWEDYAKTLAETTEWPRWEIARVATIAMQETGIDT